MHLSASIECAICLELGVLLVLDTSVMASTPLSYMFVGCIVIGRSSGGCRLQHIACMCTHSHSCAEPAVTPPACVGSGMQPLDRSRMSSCACFQCHLTVVQVHAVGSGQWHQLQCSMFASCMIIQSCTGCNASKQVCFFKSCCPRPAIRRSTGSVRHAETTYWQVTD